VVSLLTTDETASKLVLIAQKIESSGFGKFLLCGFNIFLGNGRVSDRSLDFSSQPECRGSSFLGFICIADECLPASGCEYHKSFHTFLHGI
jgi:hypothetical protein